LTPRPGIREQYLPTADLHNAPAQAIRYAGVEPEATARVKQKLIE
jgi:hypothetical protein